MTFPRFRLLFSGLLGAMGLWVAAALPAAAVAPANVCHYSCVVSGSRVPANRVKSCSSVSATSLSCATDCEIMCRRLQQGATCYNPGGTDLESPSCVPNTSATDETADPPAVPTNLCSYQCVDAAGGNAAAPNRTHGCPTATTPPASSPACLADCNSYCRSIGKQCKTSDPPPTCVSGNPTNALESPAPTAANTPPQNGATITTSGGGSTRGSSASISNPLGTRDVRQLIARLIRGAIGLVGAIALAVFVYGGITYMLAGGDAGQVKTARSILVQAFIGLMLIFFSWTIASLFLEAFVTTARLGSNQPLPAQQAAPPSGGAQR